LFSLLQRLFAHKQTSENTNPRRPVFWDVNEEAVPVRISNLTHFDGLTTNQPSGFVNGPPLPKDPSWPAAILREADYTSNCLWRPARVYACVPGRAIWQQALGNA
jgi:hypothetical protein